MARALSTLSSGISHRRGCLGAQRNSDLTETRVSGEWVSGSAPLLRPECENFQPCLAGVPYGDHHVCEERERDSLTTRRGIECDDSMGASVCLVCVANDHTKCRVDAELSVLH